MRSGITLAAALFIGTPAVAQHNAQQIIDKQSNVRGSIISGNTFNGQQGSKNMGILDKSQSIDCYQIDKSSLSLGSLIITRASKNKEGGVEITGFKEDIGCFLTGINSIEIGDSIISIGNNPVNNPTELAKILDYLDTVRSMHVLIRNKDGQAKEATLAISIWR